jgi:hypothetical protein
MGSAGCSSVCEKDNKETNLLYQSAAASCVAGNNTGWTLNMRMCLHCAAVRDVSHFKMRHGAALVRTLRHQVVGRVLPFNIVSQGVFRILRFHIKDGGNFTKLKSLPAKVEFPKLHSRLTQLFRSMFNTEIRIKCSNLTLRNIGSNKQLKLYDSATHQTAQKQHT